MSFNLTIISAAFSIFVIVLMCVLVARKYIKLKYALIWMVLFFLLLLAILIPGFLEWVTALCGFQTPSNLVISLFIAVLVILSIATTAIVSKQNKTIRILVQENSILNKEIKQISRRQNNGKNRII